MSSELQIGLICGFILGALLVGVEWRHRRWKENKQRAQRLEALSYQCESIMTKRDTLQQQVDVLTAQNKELTDALHEARGAATKS